MRSAPLVALSVLGLLLSLVLELVHVRVHLLPTASEFCALGERLDCTSVALSRFSVVLGLPLPLLGALGFVATGISALRRSRWLLLLSGAAAFVSVVLLVIELAWVHALCLLCEGVHATSIALFVLAWRGRSSLSSSYVARDDLVAIFSLPLGLLVALLLFVPRYWGIFAWKGDLPFPHGKTESGYPWIGAASPQMTVEEFTDYACPHCRLASARSLRRLADHPTTLRLVRRQYPRVHCRAGMQNSCVAVRIAYCADEQGKFWQADRWLFENGSERGSYDPKKAAADIGLGEQALLACMTRPDTYERAVEESELALKKRLPGTPYYVVGAHRAPEEGLSKLLTELR